MKTPIFQKINGMIRGLPFSIRKHIYTACGMQIGENSVISFDVHIDNASHITIGKNSHINKKVSFYSGWGGEKDPHIYIGDNVDIGPEVKLVCVSHVINQTPIGPRAGTNTYGDVVIGDRCWIGTNVIILPDIHIADGCVIGAGSVVTKDTEPDAVYVGCPARKIRDLK